MKTVRMWCVKCETSESDCCEYVAKSECETETLNLK